jgi:hypothetical protein
MRWAETKIIANKQDAHVMDQFPIFSRTFPRMPAMISPATPLMTTSA